MSKQSNYEARMDATVNREKGDEADASAGAVAPREKNVRMSADIPPLQHRYLLTYCTDLAIKYQVPRVNHVKAVRALIAELESNEELQVAIETRMRESGDI